MKTLRKFTTQLKSRLKAYYVIWRSGPMQYISILDIKKKPTTHQTHTYKNSSYYLVYYKSFKKLYDKVKLNCCAFFSLLDKPSFSSLVLILDRSKTR